MAEDQNENNGGLGFDDQVIPGPTDDTTPDLGDYARINSLDYDGNFNNPYDDQTPGSIDNIIDPMEGA